MRGWMACAAMGLLAVACEDSGGSSGDTAGGDTGVDSTSDARPETTVETMPAETTPAETTPAETNADVTPGPYGFAVRDPQVDRVVPCTHPHIPGTTFDASDADFVCTFAHEGAAYTLYFQSTPNGCASDSTLIPLPTYDTKGWVSKAGVVSALTAAQYDFGGNHHYDTLRFALDGAYYLYAHSSIGYGGRSCQNPDCLQRTSDAAYNTVVDDGCTAARTHPIVCVDVAQGGTVGSLEDTFATCPGDPNR